MEFSLKHSSQARSLSLCKQSSISRAPRQLNSQTDRYGVNNNISGFPSNEFRYDPWLSWRLGQIERPPELGQPKIRKPSTPCSADRRSSNPGAKVEVAILQLVCTFCAAQATRHTLHILLESLSPVSHRICILCEFRLRKDCAKLVKEGRRWDLVMVKQYSIETHLSLFNQLQAHPKVSSLEESPIPSTILGL
ncbi:unnamed protein product [Nezara viridula]|uniref:Uncharacterized protein n=1 Tax=Nezara viridula TaxID=85310 RepID=A0A9P0HJW3_NEZVI|nr:unnamed protein product [Nezara viridula]